MNIVEAFKKASKTTRTVSCEGSDQYQVIDLDQVVSGLTVGEILSNDWVTVLPSDVKRLISQNDIREACAAKGRPRETAELIISYLWR